MEYQIIPNQSPEEQNLKFPHIAFSLSITLLIVICYQVIGSFVIYGITGGEKNNITIFQGVNQLVFMLIPTMFASMVTPIPTKDLFRLRRCPPAYLFLLTIVGVAAFQVFVTGYGNMQDQLIPDTLRESYDNIKEFYNNAYKSLIGGSGTLDALIAMLVAAVIPAICEESLFRGLLQRSLEQKMHPLLAITITGALFGSIHLNIIDIIPLIAIGIYLGCLAYYSGSIILPIFAHFLNNGFAILMLYSGQHEALEKSNFALPLWISISLCLVGIMLICGTLFIIIKENYQKQYNDSHLSNHFS
jgi:membrane protease YdiL (CAAX protease family)